MNKFSMDLYSRVTMPTFPPSWEDVERLSLDCPAVHQAVALVRRGDITQEQALIWLVFSLADAWQKMFSAEVERRAMEIRPPLVFTK